MDSPSKQTEVEEPWRIAPSGVGEVEESVLAGDAPVRKSGREAVQRENETHNEDAAEASVTLWSSPK